MSLLPIRTLTDDLRPWRHRRPKVSADVTVQVARIIEEVEQEGAQAVLRHTQKFDAPSLTGLWVSSYDLAAATLDPLDVSAIQLAIERVKAFHAVQLGTLTHDLQELGTGWAWRTAVTESEDSGFEGQRILPLHRVGVYVPGGQASYPSSVIMNAVPAIVAGVKEIVVATPPGPDGNISAAVLVTCRELGITKILKAGGASAIAALALGWEDFERVDKIVGPGNTWVNEAKRQLWGSVGLDSYAGPSEVCVVVDHTAEVQDAAYDLLTQIEHAPDNVAVLIGLGDQILNDVLQAAEEILETAERAEIIRTALSEKGLAVRVLTQEDAVTLINDFAPEHLTLMVEDPGDWVPHVRNAGCILLGQFSPQSLGDYISGPSHTLPTSGAARFAGPVSVSDFLKIQSISALEPDDVVELSPIVNRLAALEGLPIHGEAGIRRILDQE